MKMTYRMEIGIRKEGGRILLKEKVEVEEKLMKDLLLTIEAYNPIAIMKSIRMLGFSKNDVIESIEIRED